MTALKTYRLNGSVTVSAYTEVEARSQKEALMIAGRRDASIGEPITYAPPDETWVVDEADGEPFDVYGDDEQVAPAADVHHYNLYSSDVVSEEKGELRTIRLAGKITVSTYTKVEASSLAEAKTIAAERSAVVGNRRTGALPEEQWLVEEADGMVLDIRIDEDPAATPTP